ncbi:MAG: phosphatase PAP2 family protein [Candidatus Azobacteroides sp.]|nr:phosphatase PAP2 family protein [Candidatus Azobacteroides sp.]
MNSKSAFPSTQEVISAVSIIAIYILSTAWFIGLRWEHLALAGAFLLLFGANEKSRKLVVGLIPFFIFGISYDWMRVFPNYQVNPVDVEDLFNLEKKLFGITDHGIKLIPSEYFSLHHHPIADFLSGLFYLGWVPIPVLFGIYLYFKNQKEIFLRFSLVFLLVNLIGFVFYYLHPAAPPWYVMLYGFERVFDIPGNTGGLSRFDDLIGIPLFHSIYGRNANVFAAVPSLHSAYLVVVLFYAVKDKCHPIILAIIAFFMCGIWFTAVYMAHHYIIDVLLGIFCALLGIFLFECMLMKLKFFKTFFSQYLNYIQ